MENYKTIIKVKQKSKNNSNCIVISDDGEISEISMDLVLKFKIAKQATFSIEEWNKIILEQQLILCKSTAYSFASYKPRTKKQIYDKLVTLDFSQEEIAQSLVFLEEYNLIDDYEFSRKFIQNRLLTKKIGELKIKQELASKGVDKNTIEQAIESFYPKENVEELINAEIDKKIRQISRKPKEKQYLALFNYLLGRGFKIEDIKKAIAKHFEKQ